MILVDGVFTHQGEVCLNRDILPLPPWLRRIADQLLILCLHNLTCVGYLAGEFPLVIGGQCCEV